MCFSPYAQQLSVSERIVALLEADTGLRHLLLPRPANARRDQPGRFWKSEFEHFPLVRQFTDDLGRLYCALPRCTDDFCDSLRSRSFE
jgi:hypothetical protein